MPRNLPHAWKNAGSETGRVLFLDTPVDVDEHKRLFEHHHWELVGPSPL